MNYISKLKALLKENKVVPVVGAGVSFATAGLPNWKGLIESGLEYANNHRADVKMIQEATDLLSKNELIKAASIVKKLLNGPGHPFSNWLNDTLGRPKVQSFELVESIQNLCQPIIATTNYDDLLRNTGNIQTDLALDWTQHGEIQSCLSNFKPFIFHLHGIYSRPDTTIFAADDYENLNTHVGYKTIMQNLWMNKTFLFIGCSRDGVMDEDFTTLLKMMKEWFPSSSSEHYILMRNSEIGSPAHWELMKECNVHLIPFGQEHNELAGFLNGINPNAEVILERFAIKKDNTTQALMKIFKSQPDAEISPKLEDFLKKNLGATEFWNQNNNLSIVNAALLAYNEQILDKQQKFRNQQAIVRAFVRVAELDQKIKLWEAYNEDTTKLNNLDFINMGILAFDQLKSFGPEVIQDIKLRHPNAIHQNYYSGDLLRFYQEAVTWKKAARSLEEFRGDQYFFENLRRIMSSLKGVLSLSPETLYGEKQPAMLTGQLPVKYLLFQSEKELSIREAFAPYQIVAKLPWDENLSFFGADLILYKRDWIVIGFNARHCFYWNPLKDTLSTNFHSTEKDEEIFDMHIINQGEDVVLRIFTKKTAFTIVNFSEKAESKLQSRYLEYIRLKSSEKTYCRKSVSFGMKDDCVFEYSPMGDYVPKISAIQLWEQIREIEGVHNPEEDSIGNFAYPYIQDLTIHATDWTEKDILVLRCRISEQNGSDSIVLLFVDPDVGFDKPLLKILFPNKNCFSFDTFAEGGKVDLLVGYLDYNEVDNLIQFFENINDQKIITAVNQPGIIPQERIVRTQVRDMFRVNFATKRRGFVIEEGRVLHDIILPTLADTATEIQEKLSAILYHQD
ncbi:SIR2 family protein [Pedobacter miscanthi]|uniref:SIR2 family NAD-dependent protein deacylase n=1 Tax=Pedobacter miscanthi TaxID=2259170 RepID=UPI00292FF462|nr:SIR2 family protein [Pedobacter miscanthi]